jgi:hypothetical protein
VHVGSFEELSGCVSVEVRERCINALKKRGLLTLVGRYVATTSLTLAIGPGFPFSAPMSPLGVMLGDDCRSEMGVGNGGSAAGSKMFGYPGSSRGSCDSRFRDSKDVTASFPFGTLRHRLICSRPSCFSTCP